MESTYIAIFSALTGLMQLIYALPYDHHHLWQPNNTSLDRNTWMKCHGFQCNQWNRIREKMRRIGALQVATGLIPASAAQVDPGAAKLPPEIALDEDLDALDGCIKFTEEQADEIINGFEAYLSYMGHRRKKRKIFNFFKFTFRKWDRFPIKYKFDGRHNAKEKDMVRAAMRHWEAQTCVRFQEVDMDLYLGKENHILFTREGTGCHSFIGRIPVAPQQLNLQYTCLWEFGIPVHEIGHALGFWHEHQRWDRDTAIKVMWDNVGYYSSQYYKQPTESLGVPYDISSIMHYAPRDGSINSGNVMEALDPLYQSSMGQKTGLSYLDVKLMNMAYCKAICGSGPKPRCERGGYQDPNNCDKCICPDGFGGSLCETVGPNKKAVCGGILSATGVEQEITSPNYLEKPYEDFTECNWILKAAPKQKIIFQFKDRFAVFCHKQNQCHHWVEVKYKNNLELPGPRFCCYDRPKVVLESDTPEMVVIFRANWTTYWTSFRTGFKASFKAINEDGSPVPTPVPNPNLSAGNADLSSSKPTLSTTTAPPPAPTAAPTPVPPPVPTRAPPLPPNPPSSSSSARPTLAPTPIPTSPSSSIEPKPFTPAPPAPPRELPSKQEGCPKLDIAFLLDSSGSIGLTNWDYMLDIVYQVSKSFIISEKDIQVGVITFGNEASIHIHLNDDSNIDEFSRSLRRIEWQDQWTNTSGAIRLMRTSLFSSKGGDRPDAPNYGILITDGQSNRDAHLTLAEADKALSSGIKLLVVGIGDQVDGFEMTGIALGSSNSHSITNNRRPENVLTVKDFKELANRDTREQMVKFLCPTYSKKDIETQSTWSWSCGFESVLDPFCNIEQDDGDDFDFKRWTRSTPSELTGPEAANYGSFYIYIEASNPRRPGDRATLRLPSFRREGPHCLQFAYHMYGFHIRLLEVFIQRERNTEYIWQKSGEQGQEWLTASLSIYLDKNNMIGFTAYRGDEYSGDIALDDLSLASGLC